jgi:hypothetical protein
MPPPWGAPVRNWRKLLNNCLAMFALITRQPEFGSMMQPSSGTPGDNGLRASQWAMASCNAPASATGRGRPPSYSQTAARSSKKVRQYSSGALATATFAIVATVSLLCSKCSGCSSSYRAARVFADERRQPAYAAVPARVNCSARPTSAASRSACDNRDFCDTGPKLMDLSQLSRKSQRTAIRQPGETHQSARDAGLTIRQAALRAEPRTLVPSAKRTIQPWFSSISSASRAFGLSRSRFGPR